MERREEGLKVRLLFVKSNLTSDNTENALPRKIYQDSTVSKSKANDI